MRALTGAVFVIVLVGCILWRFESFAALFLLITVLGLWEFYRLAEKDGAQPQKMLGTAVGAYLFISLFLKGYTIPYTGYNYLFFLFIPLLFLFFIIELYRKKERPFTNIGYTILGIIYVALPFSLWNLIATVTAVMNKPTGPYYSAYMVLGYFILMWTSDTGAYLSGKALGKHKLFERISPKKTWEGTIGGGILCLGVAYILSIYFNDLSLRDWIVIAIIIVVTGNLGDLAESLFKRSINIKDSGTILPGHGGILDRFDAVLISTPFVFTYLVLVK